MMRIAPRALVICALAACGDVHTFDLDETQATLVVEPATSELLILNGVAAEQNFTATLVFPEGQTRDVTIDTTFAIDSGFGVFTGSHLSLTAAGKHTVYALYTEKTAMAQVIARVKTTRVDPPLPPEVVDLFQHPEDPALAPSVIYPALDVVMPRNLGDFETHWTDAHGNDVFEVSLKTEFSDVRVYVPGNNGKPAAGPHPSWTAFLAPEWMAAVGTESTIQYQVRGVNTASPGAVGAGAPRVVRLTNEQMEGGLYYWAAAASGGGAYGIFRHDVAKAGEQPEEFMTSNQTSGRCVACHTISRDGTKMAITYDGGNGRAALVDVATREAQPDTQNWNFATFSPDGNRVITVHNGTIVVRDYAGGAILATMTSDGYASHPDLSPDGTRLVYTRSAAGSDWSFASGSLYTRTFDPVTLVFGAETPLVTDGANNFYPSWSPDGKWVLFNRSTGGSSYDNVNASLWVIDANAAAPAVLLAQANAAAGGLTNSWGRWAPFAQTVGNNAEEMYWVTVSSKRNFGVRLFGDNIPQIWMTPFFPNRASNAEDPTAPAFRLPFQKIDSNNHIAQWTERVVVTL